MPIVFQKLTVDTSAVKVCDPSPLLTSICVFHKEGTNTVYLGTRPIGTSDLDQFEILKNVYINPKWPEERVRNTAFYLVASASSTVWVWLAYAETEEELR